MMRRGSLTITDAVRHEGLCQQTAYSALTGLTRIGLARRMPAIGQRGARPYRLTAAGQVAALLALEIERALRLVEEPRRPTISIFTLVETDGKADYVGGVMPP